MSATFLRSAAEDTNECGKVISYRVLKHTCNLCPQRADYEVERTNVGLPKPYAQFGTRSIYYCADHVPQWLTNDMQAWAKHVTTPM